MFSAHRVRVAALGAALGLHAPACGNDQRHAPFASATCRTGPCSAGAILGGSVPPSGEVDSGTSQDSGTGAQSIVCHTDPTSLIELCTGSAACPKFFIDPVRFSSCGFRGAGVDVECVCNGNSLCPVAVQTDCNYVKTQLSLKTYDEICAPAVTGGCVDVNNLGAGGSLNGAGGGP
jgi:hypothetical protein